MPTDRTARPELCATCKQEIQGGEETDTFKGNVFHSSPLDCLRAAHAAGLAEGRREAGKRAVDVAQSLKIGQQGNMVMWGRAISILEERLKSEFGLAETEKV